MNWKRFSTIVATVGVLGGAGWYVIGKSTARPPGITGVVERKTLRQLVMCTGVVEANGVAIISAPFDGYVQKVFVKIGETVKAGDPIVTLTQTPDGSLSETFPLRSPLAGVVTQILYSRGSFVEKSSSARAIVRIEDRSSLFAAADTAEADYAKLKPGLAAVIRPAALPQMRLKGEIISMFGAAKQQDRWDRSRVEFPIRVKLAEVNEAIRSGMSVTTEIITAEAKDALSLRHDFVGKDGEQYFVTTSKGERRNVTIGLQTDEAFEILEGVNEGDEVLQVDFLNSSGGKVTKGGPPAQGRPSRSRIH